jgi:hypothetical protein
MGNQSRTAETEFIRTQDDSVGSFPDSMGVQEKGLLRITVMEIEHKQETAPAEGDDLPVRIDP